MKYDVQPFNKPTGIPFRESDHGRRKAFDDTAAAMIKAVDTLVPQEVPPESRELTAVDGVEIGPGGVALPGRSRRGYGGSRPAAPSGLTGNQASPSNKEKNQP